VEPSSPSPTPVASDTPRRTFLAATASIVIGGLISLTPLIAGATFFLDPLLRRRPNFKGGDAQGFLPVTKLSDLPDDGTPLRFVLRADKVDAWNEFKNQSIGTVYLRKLGGNQIVAFNDTCPHLGCKVDYQEGSQTFLCPCHASAFKLEGEPMNKIPPRALDTLEWKVDADNRVWVKYQDFQCGVEKKEVVG
jgi:menaquinol-cytochrome c reductase iron-sulfur subunit